MSWIVDIIMALVGLLPKAALETPAQALARATGQVTRGLASGREDFIRRFCQAYVRAGIKWPPCKWALAQAALETGWGSSSVLARCNNLFGMTDGIPGTWKKDTKTGFYSCFGSWESCLRSYEWKFRPPHEFSRCRGVRTAEGFYKCLERVPKWAEDPDYIGKVTSIYRRLLGGYRDN